MTLASLAQFGIALTGCVALWLVNDSRAGRRRWAPVFGLAAQPFWWYSAISAQQWGVFWLSLLYTAAWARGFYLHWIRREERP